MPFYGTLPGSGFPEGQVLNEPCWNTPAEDCPFELVGKYNFCGGRMYPAVIDDDDNLYFFTARGRLHSLDKQGKFRWRMDFCNAPPAQYGGVAQQYLTAQEYPLVMDYHGTLYFFIGDVLYGVSQDGEVLLQRRVIVPGIQPDPLLQKYGEDTDYSYEEMIYGVGNEVQIPAIAPVLDTQGRLYVAFRFHGYDTPRSLIAGYVQLDRLGAVLSYSWDYWGETHSLVGDREGRVVATEVNYYSAAGKGPCDDVTPSRVKHLVVYDDGTKWKRSSMDWQPAWLSSPVVGVNGQAYGLSSEHGGVKPVRYGAQGDYVKLAPIASTSETDRSTITWSNYPIADRDGYMYVVRDLGFSTGIGLVAFDPVKAEAEANPEVSLLDQPGKGYLWGLNLNLVVMNYGSPVLTAGGYMYVPFGTGIMALKLKTGGAEPELAWRYNAPGGAYPTAMHVLSDGTLVIGSSEGMLYFLKEKDIENGGLDTQAAWPRPYHDNYRSNNASHPIKWDRTKPAPYPSLQELLAKAPDDWNCNADTRCFPKSYHDTCDWGWPKTPESQDISCSKSKAVKLPCPDPRRYPCLAKEKIAVHPCDAPPDDPDPANCNCATPGIGSGSALPYLAVLLVLVGLATVGIRSRKRR
jgi:hypothetical protein